jgi:hypothetical protein
LYPVGRKHITEGAGFESNPSWFPLHKTRTPANPLGAGKKNVKFVTASLPTFFDSFLSDGCHGAYCRRRFFAMKKTFAGRSASRRM